MSTVTVFIPKNVGPSLWRRMWLRCYCRGVAQWNALRRRVPVRRTIERVLDSPLPFSFFLASTFSVIAFQLVRAALHFARWSWQIR